MSGHQKVIILFTLSFFIEGLCFASSLSCSQGVSSLWYKNQDTNGVKIIDEFLTMSIKSKGLNDHSGTKPEDLIELSVEIFTFHSNKMNEWNGVIRIKPNSNIPKGSISAKRTVSSGFSEYTYIIEGHTYFYINPNEEYFVVMEADTFKITTNEEGSFKTNSYTIKSQLKCIADIENSELILFLKSRQNVNP